MHIFFNLLLKTAAKIDCDIERAREKIKQCLIYYFQLNFKHSRSFNINGNFIASIREVVILISENAYHFLGKSVEYV